MPISWKGTLAQYVGRLHREHQGKSEVVVYDYVDPAVPVLTRMAAKRQAGYRSLGYAIEASPWRPVGRQLAPLPGRNVSGVQPVSDNYGVISMTY